MLYCDPMVGVTHWAVFPAISEAARDVDANVPGFYNLDNSRGVSSTPKRP